MRYLTGNDLPCESNDKQTAVSVAAQVIKQVKQTIYSIHFLLSLTFLPCDEAIFYVLKSEQRGKLFTAFLHGHLRYGILVHTHKVVTGLLLYLVSYAKAW